MITTRRFSSALILLLASARCCLGQTNSTRRYLRNGNADKQLCTLIVAEVEHKEKGPTFFAGCQVSRGRILEVKGLSQEWLKDGLNGGSIVSGETQLEINPRLIRPNTEIITVSQDDVELVNDDAEHNNRQRRRMQVTGPRNVLVVRVVAQWTEQDGRFSSIQTSSSEAELSDSIFGTFGDQVNLRKQMRKCSNFQLDFLPATGPAINNGVTTVTVNQYPYQGDFQLISAIERVLEARYGDGTLFDVDRNGPPGRLGIDHVMYCLPRGTVDGIAWAFLNHWMSVYSDEWCTYPSAQMHEIGHNLGLTHSGQLGVGEYDDQSGMMGYSYEGDESPSMCFNGAKTWQLGWYPGRHGVWNGQSFYQAGLVGVVDLAAAQSWHKVVLRVTTGPQHKEFYVWFNRNRAFNGGTKEGADRVLITRVFNPGARSWLVANLGNGQRYTFPSDLPNCPRPTISVNIIMNDNNPPPRAFVRINCL